MNSTDLHELDSAPLERFLDLGWNLHAQAPRAVAQALQQRAAGLAGDELAARAVVLADHVWLSHLADAAGLRRFVQALPGAVTAAAACQPVLGRVAWTLAVAAGEPEPPISDAARWRGMAGLWALWLHAGRVAEAGTALEREKQRALAHTEASARSALAATCHNLMGDLRDGPRGDAARDALMLAAACASKELWASAGTWVNVERADYQLSRCYSALGRGSEALQHAQACLQAVQAHAGDPQADAYETFFAHEALAWAQHAVGQPDRTAAERVRMQELLAEVSDADSAAFCREALMTLDQALPLR